MNAPKPPLFTFRFLALCLFMLLAYCNISVFYNLYVYLEQIGIAQPLRGPIISCSSLATILCFLFASPYLTTRNAPWAIFLGLALLIGCGVAYLTVLSPSGMLALRLINGAGIYLLTASAMTLLVAHIPPERSGQAFGLYSVAALLPYSIVPAAFDSMGSLLASPAHGYAYMSMALIPAALVNLMLMLQDKRGSDRQTTAQSGSKPAGLRAMFTNMRTPKIGLLLIINSVYYLNFSALFFLSKGLFTSRGLGGVGLFFSIQTCCMLLIRLFAARLFDEVDKLKLIVWCYGATAVGFGLLWGTQGIVMEIASALVLGLGMGVGPPSLNALMYSISEPKLKGVNSNLMVMALQLGSFFGPILGGIAVGMLGYAGFLAVGMLANIGGIGLSLHFRRKGWVNGPTQA